MSSTASSKSKGVSSGAAAGITLGVGTALALIAALITYILMRRQLSVRLRDAAQKSLERERSEWNESRRAKLHRPPRIWDYLPQSADDKGVYDKAETLFFRIEQLVWSVYRPKGNSGAEAVTADLSAFESPHLPKPLASVLSEARDNTPLIMHSLTHFILNLITPATATADSLLPAHLAPLFDSSASVNADKKGWSEFIHHQFGN